MSINRNDDSVKLNKTKYSVRSSQTIYQYGVGGMVDFKDQTLMTSAPELWPDKDMLVINDERLANALHVKGFKMAGGKQDSVISYVRFPEWYFCPQCRDFKPLRQWYRDVQLFANEKEKKNNPYMAKYLKCPICHKELVVTRIVTACENGHISDFPWVEWAHAKNFKGQTSICKNPILKFTTSGSSAGGMSNIIVECKTCGARASLKDAFNNNIFKHITNSSDGEYNFKCLGKHPWKHIRESCDCYPRTLQRGSSSVYYPFTVSSLVIPPYSDEINTRILATQAFRDLDIIIRALMEDAETEEEKIKIIQKQIGKKIDIIIAQAGLNDSEKADVRDYLEKKYMEKEEDVIPDSIKYKEAEYLALTGKGKITGRKGDFDREEMDISEYKLPFIKQLSLIHKVKKVQAQTGFTRIAPAEKSEEGTRSSKIVNIKDISTDWYPAVQVFGEGIFIEFDQEAIDKWIASHSIVLQRAKILNDNNRKAYPDTDRIITPRLILLHTISHLLIKQLSFECGYNIASLAERLYISEKTGNMAGIFIYTADGDSEGTLGGLVRQGRKDVFPATFRKAIESAISCSNDPVCSLSTGQGRNSLNLSACYSCTLIPETSCEEFNGLLDRGVVVGTVDRPEIGFYSDYVYGKKSWDSPENIRNSNKETTDISNFHSKCIQILEETDMSQLSYSQIWQNMFALTDSDSDLSFLKEASQTPDFHDLEKPATNISFTIKETQKEYSCLMAWKNSKILLFGDLDGEDFDAAKCSDFMCIRTSDTDAIEILLKNIKRDY